MKREAKTVSVMIAIYCRAHHNSHGQLCPECQQLHDYAMLRLEKCPYQEGKTTCAKCPTHCYKKVIRQKIREVMRYSGPRMFHRHPIATLYHFLDGRRKKPLRTLKKT
jgi:hypothetical protein